MLEIETEETIGFFALFLSMMAFQSGGCPPGYAFMRKYFIWCWVFLREAWDNFSILSLNKTLAWAECIFYIAFSKTSKVLRDLEAFSGFERPKPSEMQTLLLKIIKNFSALCKALNFQSTYEEMKIYSYGR